MAYAPELHRLFFVKMGWRPNTPDVASELATYMKLYEKNVPYIPQVVGGGDVHHGLDDASRPCSSNDSPSAPLRTLAHKFLKVDGPGKIWERFQHRLVFETIGIPLGEYANAFAMIGAVFHAFLGTSVTTSMRSCQSVTVRMLLQLTNVPGKMPESFTVT